ncbi:hypothetical protein M426DRAFT_321410 [Hypoxylon sp. CI-4A]|nr:hypothetical protein M426DRAFT_321410 [Hypoxylon sp. CI-4A]
MLSNVRYSRINPASILLGQPSSGEGIYYEKGERGIHLCYVRDRHLYSSHRSTHQRFLFNSFGGNHDVATQLDREIRVSRAKEQNRLCRNNFRYYCLRNNVVADSKSPIAHLQLCPRHSFFAIRVTMEFTGPWINRGPTTLVLMKIRHLTAQ